MWTSPTQGVKAMSAIKATVRNGRIEPDSPLDLPEGAKLLVFPEPDANANGDDDEADTPETIAKWLAWYDTLEPLILTDEERRAWDERRAAQKEWEQEHFEERAEKLRRMWE
jgi:hypothetical protein